MQNQQSQDSLKEQQNKQYGDIDTATSTANELSAKQDFGGVATAGQFPKDVKTPSMQDIHMNSLGKAQESLTKGVGGEGLVIIIILVFFIGFIFKRKQ